MTINYVQGNLLAFRAEALVNAVNEIGVMGAGIAAQFRGMFPESSEKYIVAAKAGKVKVGKMFVTSTITVGGLKWIIHFPTKKHWRDPSKFEWIQEGLKDLKQVIIDKEIKSIGLPALGCGLGGLDWFSVRDEIEEVLGDLTDVDITVFKPVEKYYDPSY